MYQPFETVTDLQAQADVLKRRAHGVIEMVDEQLHRVRLRPWPKMVSIAEIALLGRWFHRHAGGNRSLVYYDQPWSCPNFLTLKYALSSKRATLKNARGALVVLDEIARIKQTDAIVCEASNLRISDRLLRRWGWERHVPDSPRRHYIKRFYGHYAPPHEALSLAAGSARCSAALS